jgi:hypothetical protein
VRARENKKSVREERRKRRESEYIQGGTSIMAIFFLDP